MDKRFNGASPRPERTWSTEALRGSLDVNRPMAQSTSPSSELASTGLNVVEAAAAKLETSQKSALARWLDSPGAEDVSPVVDAVSELFSARGESTMTSPATSCSSSVPSLFARKQSITSAYHLSPTSPHQAQAPRGSNRAGGPSSSSLRPRQGSSSAELREVGAFASASASAQQYPRRQYRYRPLSNWVDLWLPEEPGQYQGQGQDRPADATTGDQSNNDSKEGTKQKE